MKNGIYTEKLGEKLTKRLKQQANNEIEVYYDHGDSNAPNVCAITPYFGKLSRSTQLANVDLAVVNLKENKLILLCEVEEEGGSPKKIIGDVCNLLIAEKVKIKDRRYPLSDFHFLLGIRFSEKGGQIEKLANLRTRIRDMVQPELLENRTIQFIHATNNEQLVVAVEEEICKIIGLSRKTI